MRDSIVTPNRLTVMLPILTAQTAKSYMRAMDRFFDDAVGIKAVHNILVRKGQSIIKYSNGRLRPVAQAMMNKNMARLRANENPADIVRDMQAQLLLLLTD